MNKEELEFKSVLRLTESYERDLERADEHIGRLQKENLALGDACRRLLKERNDLAKEIDRLRNRKESKHCLHSFQPWQLAVMDFINKEETISFHQPGLCIEQFLLQFRTLAIHLPRRSGKSYLADYLRCRTKTIVLSIKDNLPPPERIRGLRIDLLVLDDTKFSVHDAIKWTIQNRDILDENFKIVSLRTNQC